ncbi:CRISPR-associated protein Cmr3 [Seinonella peptonophila]|uniref:CRISPR-associated protein Cmr3 n=1 Tax=Seinonella peptonophila TaxID=112248 RepID=A0A1M5BMG8_9BACL|nr:type III-B CRISPR module-associated Cmr3 family protein [Seinonella peptonophila]SHF43698.1 CRISPR-associated protein Cmr3 [Seinonella peptonophila]
MQTWTFRAIDSWFFRDGTPFHSGETAGLHHRSMFPPPISAIQGAIRTTLARSRGWTERDKTDIYWPKELGDYESLGELSFRGPYLRWRNERLYPIPLTLIGDRKRVNHRLIPSYSTVSCDMGNVRLVEIPDRKKGKLLTGWVNKEGMQQILAGGFLKESQIYLPSELYQSEFRIGLQRDNHTLQANEGYLYSSVHVRPYLEVRIEVEVTGIPSDWKVANNQLIPFGGEGRFADVEVTESKTERIVMPLDRLENSDPVRFYMSLLTPGVFADVKKTIERGPLADLSCVSGSISRVVSQGSWDQKHNMPRKNLLMIPAGSTWFYETDQHMLETIQTLHHSKIGNRTEYGYGEIAIGRWTAKK